MYGVKFKDSIRFKFLSVTIVFILFPVILFSIIYSNLVKEIIYKKYSESAIQSVYETGKNINFILDDISEFSNMILVNRDLLKALNNSDIIDSVTLGNMLRSFFTSREDIEGIYLLIANKLYSVGAIKVAESKDYMPIDILNKSEGEIIWTNTRPERIKILSGEFDKYYFSLGRKLIDFNTLKQLGLISITIDEGVLEKSYRDIMKGESEQVFICNEEGIIISHRNKERIGQSIKEEIYSQEVLTSGNESGYISFKDKGIEKMAIYTTCAVNGWRIVKIIPHWYLYKEIEEIQWKLILLAVVYVIITMYMALIWSKQNTEPIVNMMKVMKKAERGNLDIRLDLQRKDEIGQLGISFDNMIGEMKTLIDKLVKEERLKKEIELEVLHAQINPHFLYNTLNSIKWMAKIQGSKSISNAVTALIKLLRISINLGRDMIPLSDEIEYVKNYILIQQLRFNGNFTIDYDIAEDCLSCNIPKLILQPIVENSLIYGSDEENQNSLAIAIKAYRQEDMLIIEVMDNGPGIKPEVLKNILKSEKDVNKFSKVGLNNVNQRVKLYFGDDYGIEIDAKENKGTKITVELPYRVE